MSLSTAQAHYVAETSVPELHAHVRMEFGTVLLRQQSSVHVRVNHGKVRAEVAIGCLRAPTIGDRVLVVWQDDEAYVLSVLRSEQDETVLEFDRELSVRVKGTLRVLAEDGMQASSPKSFSLTAAELSTEVDRMRLGFGSLDLVGRVLSSKTKQIRVVAETFDTLASRIYQRAVNFLRRTDELDCVEAKHIERRAEQLLHMHGENTVTTAEQLVKIDASQVHVG